MTIMIEIVNMTASDQFLDNERELKSYTNGYKIALGLSGVFFFGYLGVQFLVLLKGVKNSKNDK